MEDGHHHHHHHQQQHEEAPKNGGSSSNSVGSERNNNNNNSEPVRSRWTPKPEQILILESIFNSGMVNPPKDETVRIRKLLENFGSVGDANVFYWFQNRRSRSRRRQRQIQATAMSQHDQQQQHPSAAAGGLHFDINNNNNNNNNNRNIFTSGHDSSFYSGGYNGGGGGSSCSSGNMGDDHMSCLYSSSYSGGRICGPGIEQNSCLSSSFNVTHDPAASSHLHFQSPPGVGAVGGGGYITVFINGVATEIARGPLDMKAMFGQQHQDLVLLHSSGLPVNDFTFPLQHGESYFLVSRPT